MRIITGALNFFDSSAGMTEVIVPVALLPKPPPVYSLIKTTSFGSRCSQRDTDPTVCTTLCVEQCMYSLPFCQYAIAVRGSSVWWLVFGVTNVSSRTSAASLNPASRLPYDHSSGVLPIGSRPCAYSAASASVHFRSSIAGGDTGCPGLGGFGLPQMLPSSRALAPPGNRLLTGSTSKGNGSQSISIFSMASAAVSSSTAATASTGSPWYAGSLVNAFSPLVLALIVWPRSVTTSAGGGNSSAVRIPFTPGILSALLA